MRFYKFMLLAASVATVLITLTPLANASSFSAVVVYGDSLSDNGNLYAAIGYPPSPYYQGRFSNGPVAVEQLAAAWGVPLFDFAYGGATTGIGNYVDGGTQTTPGTFGLPGMQVELAGSAPLLTPALASSALFVVWGGANDFFASGSVTTAVADIDYIVATLQADGVQHILVPGLPDIGLTPEYYGDPAATAYSVQFNSLLLASLPSGVSYADTFTLLDQMQSDPAAFGFTDVKDPCFNGTSVCSNPNQYLFWDGVHPTTATDAFLAEEFAAAATPEPSSILLLGSGISGLIVLVRNRRRRTA